MYFTCAATVRFRSESCPLGSRTRAVARMVRMELPSRRSICAGRAEHGDQLADAFGSEGRDPPLAQQHLDAIRRQADRRQHGGVGGVGVHLVLGAEHGEAVHQPAAPDQAGFAGAGFALGGDVGSVKNLGCNAFHRKQFLYLL